MIIEDELARSLERHLGALDTGGADPGAARRAGARIRRRRRLGVGALVVVLMLVTGVLWRPDGARRAEPAAGSLDGSWSALPDLPMGPRAGSAVAWTGRELVVVGGGTPQDPEGGSRSGAAYRPTTGSWRGISDSPVTVPSGAASYSVNRYVVIEIDPTTWLTYDSITDVWRRLAPPPLWVSVASAGGHRVYALDVTDRVSTLDPATGVWTLLPTDPGVIALRRAASGDELTLTGYDHGVVVATTGGSADLWDGRQWTSRSQPEPGWVRPTNGAWQRLPDPPDGSKVFPVTNGTETGAVAMAGSDYLWDDADGRWAALGAPPAEIGTDRHWADGRMYQVGGLRVSSDGQGTIGLTSGAWEWTAR